MNAASPKIILERLKEEWVGVADASIYRELELEKQLWMLAAVKALEIDDHSVTASSSDLRASNSTSRKILSLYENKASSSFLSASNPNLEIHHLSTSPLLPKHYPNVRPLAIPGPSTQLPYASNIFASIHAFSLPALLPASSIPALLKDCQRTLTSSHQPCSPAVSPTAVSFPSPSTAGSLHLTILDPSPINSTLGPLLRAWLDTHLIVNLERQFRCINPARLFPIWLADAGLRAEGSTISNVRFLASVSHDPDGFSMIDDAGQEQDVVGGECVKQELKSMVGRMLWKEMWGPFVEGEKWWWEDEKIIEECESVGTCWEYAIIQAVKEA
ncbi:hypothetical protein D0Z07_6446 [Hyphodiscus hymeniophilus]|uniref:Uncharacterized protein n=1 Tax=Hyphodiscus hymeniophilus TaxID=353542 RepID=A0A9P6VFG8_9HELO|nr:hypothetical protein D0Z07_6446 [Hyphodiscus hymeniophilus]